ncbi:MAG: hypothetical protein Q9195_004665 [Heterodermia aff. obscurata]
MYIHRKNQASSDSSNHLGRWVQSEGMLFGIISLCVLLGLIVFGGIALIIYNWGWWRVRNFERRRRYVKTWHGWTNKQRQEERLRLRQERQGGLRNKFRWKTTSADMSWMFWDPRGSKQQLYTRLRQTKMLNWLPRWMRSWPPGASKPDVPFDLQQEKRKRGSGSRPQDLELGIVNHPSYRRRNDFEGEAIAQVDGPPSDIHTATVTQFFTPVHGLSTPIWAENLFGQHSPSKPNLKPSKQPSSATVTLAPSDQNHAPLPGRNTLRQERNAVRRTIQSSPTPMQPHAASALNDLHSSTILSTSIEFESLFTYIDPGSRYGRFGTTNPPRRLVDLDGVKPIDESIYSQSLTQRPGKKRRPSIGNIFPSLRRHLSRVGKAPTAPQTAPDVQTTTLGPTISSANPQEEHARGETLNVPLSKIINPQSPIVSPTSPYDEQGPMHQMQAVERLSPLPTRSPDTLHPPKKRLSEPSFSPSTPALHAVSGNSTSGIIPSLSLPDPRPILTSLPNPSALMPSRYHTPQEMSHSLDIGSRYLSPPPSSSSHKQQRSLDESAFEPRRALRRVGNLQNRSLGAASGSLMSGGKWTGREGGGRSEGKENEQVCCRGRRCGWEVEGLDRVLMRPVFGGEGVGVGRGWRAWG